MPKKKPEPPTDFIEYDSSKKRTKRQPNSFTEVGSSPVPGITLSSVLRGHNHRIGRMSWSPDGIHLASPSWDCSTRIWNTKTGECIWVIEYASEARTAAWSPNGELLAIGYSIGEIHLWDVNERKLTCIIKGHVHEVHPISWSRSGDMLASGCRDDKVRIWDTSGKLLSELSHRSGYSIDAVCWAPNADILASGDNGKGICLWTPVSSTGRLKKFEVDAGGIYSIAWLPGGKEIICGYYNRTIEILSVRTGKKVATLEGHAGYLTSLTFSHDHRLLASKSGDGEIIIWRTETWQRVCSVKASSLDWESAIAFNPRFPVLAIQAEEDEAIYLLDVDIDKVLETKPDVESVHYTTAKLVLVGDSGVGKTGLGWRLAHNEFKEQVSTHGQQFWPITKLGIKRKDGTECEAVLWDLAGQHVYRQVHSIFLENIAVALVVFDPSNRQEPLKGVNFWLGQLKHKGQLPAVVLIGGRVDRGMATIPQQELEQFCQRYGIRGGYISTSASNGEGLDTLQDTLNALIPWDEMTATVTTVTFKRIKDYVLALKENPDRKRVLITPQILCEQLQASDKSWQFTDREMMTAVGHLETHGYVAILRSSAGDEYILLTPDLLVTLASSIVLLADKNPRELGAISENALLQGTHRFSELAGLEQAETQILLDAAVLRFLQHNICFRETLNNEAWLIFPALIKQKRPLQDNVLSNDDMAYVVRGRVENLYASLVVLLGHTPSFTRINQWQNQAQYEMGKDEICGFRLIEDRDGEIELVLYYGDQLPSNGRMKFLELFEQFLYQRDVEVTRFPPVLCTNKHQQKRSTVIERVRERKPFMFCDECGDKITLPDFDKPSDIGIGTSPWLQREEAAARLRSAYEVHLTKVKSYRRGWATPRCYISRLPEQETWMQKLGHDLREAGVYIVEQAADVQPSDFVIILDTPAYQNAFATSLLANDAQLVRSRLGGRQLISIALTGQEALHDIVNCSPVNVKDETHYPVSLFNLVLALYAIPLTHAAFVSVRQALHQQWEQTLGGLLFRQVTELQSMPLKLFISYAHKEDEQYKDDLLTVLKPLERRGIIKVWHDRKIEEGDEWRRDIENAMSECEMALLFVSKNFLASSFINDKELPRLLQRRKDEGLRVVPIIIGPCMWKTEPILADLQALPQDGKAVVTFSADSGARDQLWTDIATIIEKRASEKSRGKF